MARITIHQLNPVVGDRITLFAVEEQILETPSDYVFDWKVSDQNENIVHELPGGEENLEFSTDGFGVGSHIVEVTIRHKNSNEVIDSGRERFSLLRRDIEGELNEQAILEERLKAPNSGAAITRGTSAIGEPGRGNGLSGGREPIPVSLQRSSTFLTDDVPLWVAIRKSAQALSFNSYSGAMEHLLCGFDPYSKALKSARDMRDHLKRALPFNDTDAYRFLKVATEAYFLANVQSLSKMSFDEQDAKEVNARLNTQISESDLNNGQSRYLVSYDTKDSTRKTLPYLALIRRKLSDQEIKNSVFASLAKAGESDPGFPEECRGILADRLEKPLLISLIWSYWHEEGMLVQTTNAISRRFQNIRGPGSNDPLVNMEIDPLRPLNNVLWGYVQDEQHRLTVRRRAYEYDHHYGFSLQGKAVGALRTADSRSKFLEAFHNLLSLATAFYQQDDDTTIVADAFPLMNALRDTHMILSQGAHNQFGDLPSTARQEMLLQQWLLARPEFREFLPTRIMVAYPEPWMDRVEAMKSVQGWTDTSILHFHNLAVYGEQVLLSIRYGNWSDPNTTNQQAANWARFWRQEVQGYIYAYRTATGVDLTAEMTDNASTTNRYLPPSVHLVRQLELQKRGALPGIRSPVIVQPLRTRNRLPR
jgi:hypothetical protein